MAEELDFERPTPRIVTLAPGKQLDLNPVAPRSQKIIVTPTEAPGAFSNIKQALEQTADHLVSKKQLRSLLSKQESDQIAKALIRLLKLVEDNIRIRPAILSKAIFWVLRKMIPTIIDKNLRKEGA